MVWLGLACSSYWLQAKPAMSSDMGGSQAMSQAVLSDMGLLQAMLNFTTNHKRRQGKFLWLWDKGRLGEWSNEPRTTDHKPCHCTPSFLCQMVRLGLACSSCWLQAKPAVSSDMCLSQTMSQAVLSDVGLSQAMMNFITNHKRRQAKFLWLWNRGCLGEWFNEPRTINHKPCHCTPSFLCQMVRLVIVSRTKQILSWAGWSAVKPSCESSVMRSYWSRLRLGKFFHLVVRGAQVNV